MHRATKITELPALTVDFLHHSGLLMGNLFASLWKRIGMKTLLSRAGFKKRSGTAIDEVVYALSFHLAAIRFCLLVIGKQMLDASTIAQMRQELCSNSTDISFAAKLWQVFRAVISGALDELKSVLGDMTEVVLETIDAHIQCLFVQVLQLDLKTLRLEAL